MVRDHFFMVHPQIPTHHRASAASAALAPGPPTTLALLLGAMPLGGTGIAFAGTAFGGTEGTAFAGTTFAGTGAAEGFSSGTGRGMAREGGLRRSMEKS